MLLHAHYQDLWSLKPNIRCFLEDTLKKQNVIGSSHEEKG